MVFSAAAAAWCGDCTRILIDLKIVRAKPLIGREPAHDLVRISLLYAPVCHGAENRRMRSAHRSRHNLSLLLRSHTATHQVRRYIFCGRVFFFFNRVLHDTDGNSHTAQNTH